MAISDDLRKLYAFVLSHGGTTAREAGKILQGGKSRANHYLYGYEGILFTKRGLAPPRWSVLSKDSLESLDRRIVPPAPRPKSTDSSEGEAAPALDRHRPILSAASSMGERPDVRQLPPIAICNSCDLPIKPNGQCACS